MNDYPALSFCQPYAWLSASGIKLVDNRKRRVSYRGRIYIHASRYCLLPGFGLDWIWARLDSSNRERFAVEATPDKLPTHAIIGEATLSDCIWVKKWDSSPWFEGPVGLVLVNPKLYDTPIPMMGALGLWYPDFQTGRAKRRIK